MEPLSLPSQRKDNILPDCRHIWDTMAKTVVNTTVLPDVRTAVVGWEWWRVLLQVLVDVSFLKKSEQVYEFTGRRSKAPGKGVRGTRCCYSILSRYCQIMRSKCLPETSG